MRGQVTTFPWLESIRLPAHRAITYSLRSIHGIGGESCPEGSELRLDTEGKPIVFASGSMSSSDPLSGEVADEIF